ncbi:hypothetical protein [Dactylosporangium sp. NPDC049140]|uniref:hypothetical protein n=1 Tax=Dactylosporangium sp. NPDC049140 TaxID=3155647 RepID=UPI0033F477AD
MFDQAVERQQGPNRGQAVPVKVVSQKVGDLGRWSVGREPPPCVPVEAIFGIRPAMLRPNVQMLPCGRARSWPYSSTTVSRQSQ